MGGKRIINEVLEEATGKLTTRISKSSSKTLGKNLQKAGIVRPKNTAAHHIVAGNDPRAAQARAILSRAGIDINDARNGVFLPTNTNVKKPPAATHSTLHTDEYYQKVTTRLQQIESDDVSDELEAISDDLEKGTFQ